MKIHSRRNILRLSGVGIAAGLAGCSSGIASDDAAGREEKIEIVESYNDALDQYEDAFDYYEDGGDAWEDEDFSTAINQLNESKARFGIAVMDFHDVEDDCLSIGESDAADICSEAAEVCRHLEDASLFLRRAAEDYQDENHDSGESNWESYGEQHQQARQKRIRGSGVLADTLSLET